MRHGFDTSLLVAGAIACRAAHAGVRQPVLELRNAGDGFAVPAQVVTEFVRVVTDAKRFTAPLTLPHR